MASKVDMCNLALTAINARQITSLTDIIQEARICNLHFNFARDAVLRDFDWAFARRRKYLALLDETVTGWTYVYQMPSDCVAPREIIDPSESNDSQPIEYERGEINGSQVIMTNQENAELKYTARIEDPNMYDVKFIDAFALMMAKRIAKPLKGTENSTIAREYDEEIERAKAHSGNEGHRTPKTTSSFVRSRR